MKYPLNMILNNCKNKHNINVLDFIDITDISSYSPVF